MPNFIKNLHFPTINGKFRLLTIDLDYMSKIALILATISLVINVILIALALNVVFGSSLDKYLLEKGLPKYCKHINLEFPDKLPDWCPTYLK